MKTASIDQDTVDLSKINYKLERQVIEKIDHGVKEHRLYNILEKSSPQAYLRIDTNPSKLKAFLTCSGKVSLQDVREAFEEKGIRIGIQKSKIKSYLDHKKPFALLVAAIGQDVVEGKEESMNLVKEEFLAKDHFDQLDLVYRDDIVAEITEEQAGIPGRDIFGHAKPPIMVQTNVLKPNDTILRLNTDGGAKLIAQVDGYVRRTSETIEVATELVVERKFKATMGNIYFNNNIRFKEELEGAYVETVGDVVAESVVMAASIKCKELELQCGVNGQKKSVLDVENDMRCNYISDAIVNVGDTLTLSKYAYWSEVSAKAIVGDDVKVVGGQLLSHESLTLGVVGSETMTGRAEIICGMNMQDYKVNMILKKQMDALLEKEEELQKSLRGSSGDRKNNLLMKCEVLNHDKSELQAEIDRLTPQILERNPEATITLNNGIQGRINFIIAGVEKEVQLEDSGRIQLRLNSEGSDIVFKSLGAKAP